MCTGRFALSHADSAVIDLPLFKCECKTNCYSFHSKRLRNVALRLNVFVNYHPAMQRQTESPSATSDVIFCLCLACLQYLLSQRVISNAKWYHGWCASHTLLRSWQSGSYQHRWKHISGAASIALIYVFVVLVANEHLEEKAWKDPTSTAAKAFKYLFQGTQVIATGLHSHRSEMMMEDRSVDCHSIADSTYIGLTIVLTA